MSYTTQSTQSSLSDSTNFMFTYDMNDMNGTTIGLNL